MSFALVDLSATEHTTSLMDINGTIEDCVAALPQSKRRKLTEPIKVDIGNVRIRQPANGDPIIEVIHEPNGPDSPDGAMAFYLGGLHKQGPVAATAFSASHDGPLNNEPPNIATKRREEMVAVITKMREHVALLTDTLTGACKYSHSTMTFDAEDLATKLRRIESGDACELVSYTALCCS